MTHMDTGASEMAVHTHSSKPKLLKRFLRGGTVKDKVQSDSFGGNEIHRRRGLSASPLRASSTHDSRGHRRRGSGNAHSGLGTAIAPGTFDSRNSPSPSRSSSNHKREMSELDYYIKNNLEATNTNIKKMSPIATRKNRIPPTGPSSNQNSHETHPPIADGITRSSSSSIGLTKNYSGLSLNSVERTVKRVNSKVSAKVSYKLHNDDAVSVTSKSSKSSLKRGLSRKSGDPSFVRRFTSALNADWKKTPPGMHHSQSNSRSNTPTRIEREQQQQPHQQQQQLQQPHIQPPRTHPRSAVSPPRSLTITNDGTLQQIATSPLSTGHTSETGDEINITNITTTSNNTDKDRKKDQENKKFFDEDATAREVIDALAEQEAKNKKKSSSKSPKTTTPIQSSTTIDDEPPKTKKISFSPMTLALDLVGGLGAAVQTCSTCACGEDGSLFQESSIDSNSMFARNGSLMTMDTYEKEQLLDDIERFERMNSWDTHGTLNTVGTINTVATNDTGFTSVMTGMTGMTGGTMDDDGNPISAEAMKDHLLRKQVTNKLSEAASGDKKKRKKKKKKKKKKRNKVVGFEYPPISTMKEIPRITSEERKKLFFTEDELEEYEADRRYNVSDDVEVVAVEGSDSEDDESETDSEEDDDDDDDEDSIDKWITGKNDTYGKQGNTSALRQGRYANNNNQESATAKQTGESNRAPSTPRARSNKSEDDNQQPPSLTTSKTCSNSNEGEGRGKKLKGVQIYLRQRSKAT